MADRESRFQMRQRGAGARIVEDFSFNIGSISSDRASTPDDASVSNAPVPNLVVGDDVGRQQRFLMRQRGAGARDVDFSLNLGVPVTSSPTGRVSIASSTRSEIRNDTAKIAPSPLQRSTVAPVAQMVARSDDGAVAKRRRLSPEVAEEALFIGDDGSIQEPFQEIASPASAVASTSSLATGSTGSTKRRKKKKSVLRKPKKRKATNSGSSIASSVITEENEEEAVEAATTSKNEKKALRENRNPRQTNQTVPERSPSLEDAEGEPEETVDQLNAESSRNQESAGPSQQPRLYNIFNQANRSTVAPRMPAVQRILSEHGVSNKENRSLNISTKPKTTTRTPKQAKATSSTKATRKRKGSKQQSTQERQKSSQVVITVQRVSNISRLNFITEEDDELTIDKISTLRQKKSPNAIDVLAQTCHEIIDKRIKALSTDPRLEQDGQKGIIKRQIETFRRFGEELASRLLMMTTALDHNISLTHKLKEANRLKAQNRTDLLDLRKQRQDIELQQDAIRAANEAETTQAAERFELNTLLGDIQLAVQRGKDGADADTDDTPPEEPKESLNMRLQRAGEVVGPAAKMRLLQRVRQMNALLEGLLEEGV